MPSLPISEIEADDPEVDLVVKSREMIGIERGDHDAAERLVPVEEAARELHRPFAAGAADHRLADEQLVFAAVYMDLDSARGR